MYTSNFNIWKPAIPNLKKKPINNKNQLNSETLLDNWAISLKSKVPISEHIFKKAKNKKIKVKKDNHK